MAAARLASEASASTLAAMTAAPWSRAVIAGDSHRQRALSHLVAIDGAASQWQCQGQIERRSRLLASQSIELSLQISRPPKNAISSGVEAPTQSSAAELLAI